MFADHYPDLNTCPAPKRFLIQRITDIEEFLQKDAAKDGARFDIFPAADEHTHGDTIHILHTDAHGRREWFTAQILTREPSITGQGVNAMLVFQDLGAFAVACEYEGHPYDAEANVMSQRLSAEIYELRDTLTDEVALRSAEKAPRHEFDFELKATPVDDRWTLRARPEDRLWTEPSAPKQGLFARLRAAAATRRPQTA